MFKETSTIDRIEIVDSGHIQVRTVTHVFKDDIEIAHTYHRHVIEPGGDLSKEDPRVIRVALAAWNDPRQEQVAPTPEPTLKAPKKSKKQPVPVE